MCSRKTILRISLFVFFLAHEFSFFPVVYGAWTTYIADSTLTLPATSMSLDVDSNGFVHISYVEQGGSVVKHAQWNGSVWNVSELAGGLEGGITTSIAVNAQGYPRIAYSDSSGFVMCATFSGGGWSNATVWDQAVSGVPAEVSLALNDQGDARISFYDTAGENLKYASFNGTDWVLSNIAVSGQVGRASSIELAGNGYARISYYDETSTTLQYAAYNGTGWSIQTIATGIFVYNGTAYDSLALDSSGYGHMSYFKSGSGLYYASFNGTGWVSQVADSNEMAGSPNSLVLDSFGYAYISYFQDTGDAYIVKLAHFNGTGWDVQTLYNNLPYGGMPTESSLGIYQDYVYFTFMNENGDLILTTNAPAGFVPEPGLGIAGKILLFSLPLFVIFRRRKDTRIVLQNQQEI